MIFSVWDGWLVRHIAYGKKNVSKIAHSLAAQSPEFSRTGGPHFDITPPEPPCGRLRVKTSNSSEEILLDGAPKGAARTPKNHGHTEFWDTDLF